MAAEDVGLADPEALKLAVAARDAYHMLGAPEGYLPLAEMTIYLATAPKSNRTKVALAAALEAARRTPAEPVPLHIRNAPTALMKDLGYGGGYQYAHDSPTGYTPQEYLPEAAPGQAFYEPSEMGFEKRIRERLEWWEQTAGADRRTGGQTDRRRGEGRDRSSGVNIISAPFGRLSFVGPHTLLDPRYDTIASVPHRPVTPWPHLAALPPWPPAHRRLWHRRGDTRSPFSSLTSAAPSRVAERGTLGRDAGCRAGIPQSQSSSSLQGTSLDAGLDIEGSHFGDVILRRRLFAGRAGHDAAHRAPHVSLVRAWRRRRARCSSTGQ